MKTRSVSQGWRSPAVSWKHAWTGSCNVVIVRPQTCRQQLRPATAFLEKLLYSSKARVLDLPPPTPRNLDVHEKVATAQLP